MKIGVISDTHGNIVAWKKALTVFEGADMIVHAGDVLYHPPRLGFLDGYDIPALAKAMNECPIPIVMAQGNCDPEVVGELLKTPLETPYAHIEFEGVGILVNHGHKLTREGMVDLAKRYGARYFVSGHTHIPVLDRVDGVVLVNPGSPSIPKLEISGRLTPTVGLITGSGAAIVDIDSVREVMTI